MKKLLLFAFGWLPAAAGLAHPVPTPPAGHGPAGPEPPARPKEASTILVQRRDSGLVALTALVQGLVNRDYEIKDVDRQQLTVRTEPRAVSEVGAVVIEAAVRGHQMAFRGAYAPELTSRRSTPIAYPGAGRAGRAAEAWKELAKTAGLLGRRFSYGGR